MKQLVHLFNPATLGGALGLAAVFVVIGVALTALIKFLLRKAVQHDREEHLDRLALSFLGNLGAFFLWVILAIIYVRMVPGLDKLGSALIAGAGIASVVIGLAAQSTLGNLVSGISLVLYKPFRMGDRIQITAPTGVETGIVESVTLGYTVLRTFDNRRIVLSNSLISSQIMINLTSVEPRVMLMLPVSIGYGSDIDKARALILKLAAEHPEIEEVVGCPVTTLGASSVDFMLQGWCSDAGVARRVRNEMLEQVKKSFDANGIEIPFAYQNVILQNAKGDAGEDGAG